MAPFGSARFVWRAGLDPTTTHVHVLLAEPVQAHNTAGRRCNQLTDEGTLVLQAACPLLRARSGYRVNGR